MVLPGCRKHAPDAPTLRTSSFRFFLGSPMAYRRVPKPFPYPLNEHDLLRMHNKHVRVKTSIQHNEKRQVPIFCKKSLGAGEFG